jgi:nitric oxide reductase subunit C
MTLSFSKTAVSRALAAGVLLLAIPGASRAGAPDGKKIFTQKNCVVCHSVGGPSSGPGPELTQVGHHRDRAWLKAWLTDPQKIKKDTVMPKMTWQSPEEMDAVIDYILSFRAAIPPADSANGEKLFADFKCNACHAIKGKGGKPQFPDLKEEAKEHTAAWLDKWLQDPQAIKKGTFMATFPLTNTQRKALVSYIVSLKK